MRVIKILIYLKGFRSIYLNLFLDRVLVISFENQLAYNKDRSNFLGYSISTLFTWLSQDLRLQYGILALPRMVICYLFYNNKTYHLNIVIILFHCLYMFLISKINQWPILKTIHVEVGIEVKSSQGQYV